MTKELKFDLHFQDGSNIMPLTKQGSRFLFQRDNVNPNSDVYKAAVAAGLHCRFETAEVRDKIVHT